MMGRVRYISPDSVRTGRTCPAILGSSPVWSGNYPVWLSRIGTKDGKFRKIFHDIAEGQQRLYKSSCLLMQCIRINMMKKKQEQNTQVFGQTRMIDMEKTLGQKVYFVHTSQNSFYNWTKSSSLEINIFDLEMMVKSGLDFFFILKFQTTFHHNF